jgi:putative transposase
MINKRNITPSTYIGNGLYLYFLGLFYRNISKALSFLHIVKRSHVAICKWIQKCHPQRILTKRKMISKYIIVDETQLKAGSELIWLWVAIDSKNKQILALFISKERNMFVVERYLSNTIKEFGKHPTITVSTDGGTWYPQACQFLKLKHRLQSSYEKSLIERTMQYIKDRTESFDDYFPYRLENYKIQSI